MRKSPLSKWLLVCLFSTLIMMRGSAQQPTPTPHDSPLSIISADSLANGDVVLTFVSTGDLPGQITLTLHPAANGSYSGEWAFTVAYADNTDPDTGIDPELAEGAHYDDGDHPHRGFLRLVNRGSLQGAVSSATLSLDADGALTGVAAALSIERGGKEFDGATGSGQATLSGLTLTF